MNIQKGNILTMNIQNFFESIKIRKLIGMYILIIFITIVFSELPSIKKISALDLNFWLMMVELILLIWFAFKIIKNKVDIKSIINDFIFKVSWREVISIVIINIIFSIGASLTLLYIAYKINPEFFNTLLSDSEMDNNTFSSLIYNFIAATFFAPIVEELMCRGVLLHRLSIRWKVSTAIIVSSILFGLMHVELAIVGAAVFGVMMSLLYLKSQNILMAISAHFLNNLIISLLSIILFFFDNSPENVTVSSSEINILGGVGMILLAVSLFFICKYINKNWPKERDKINTFHSQSENY